MKVEDIVKKLNNVNSLLNQGELANPSSIIGGKLRFFGTKEELKEVVTIIGDWSHKRETLKMVELQCEKENLELQLKDKLNDD